VTDALLLRPLSVKDARTLFFISSHYLREMALTSGDLTDSDKLRQTEWPFCDERALLQALAGWRQTRVGRYAAAYAICIAEEERGPSATRTIGALVVSAYDAHSRSAQLGTYIAPDWRAKGLSRQAKERLFARLGHTVDTYYCIVRADNTAALRALGKLPYARRAMAATLLPDAIAKELWLAGRDSVLFELRPSP